VPRHTAFEKGLVLGGLLAVAALIYAPGIAGPFVFDDYTHILNKPALRMDALTLSALRDAAFSSEASYPKRGLSRLSFGLNYFLAGGRFDARAFKATNIAIHLFNGVLVWALSLLLLRRVVGLEKATRGISPAWWSLAIAGIWLLHPLQFTSVLYVAQRMTSLAGLFVFGGLCVFTWGRSRLEDGRSGAWSRIWLGLGLGTALGFLSKESAALLPLFTLLVELFFFRRAHLTALQRRGLWVFYGLTALLPVSAGTAYLVTHPDFITGGYVFRDFTLVQRLLTEPRVLFFYLSLWFYPNLGRFGLFHDDLPLSTGWLAPWTTLASILAWVVLTGAALWSVRRRSPWAFAVLWFVVGHAIESTAISLELAHEHRNYVPSFGLALACGYYLLRLLGMRAGLWRMAPAVVAALLAVLAFTTYVRAGIWGERGTLTRFMARNHPDSVRSQGTYAAYLGYFARRPDASFAFWRRAATLAPTEVLALVEMERVVALHFQARRMTPPTVTASGSQISPDLLADRPPGDPLRLVRIEVNLSRLIVDRLRRRALPASTVSSLQELTYCALRSGTACAILRGRVAEWLDVALASAGAVGRRRAVLLLARAALYVAHGEPDQALALTRESIRVDPLGIEQRIRLINLDLESGDVRAAKAAFAAAREALPEGRYSRDFARIERRLAGRGPGG